MDLGLPYRVARGLEDAIAFEKLVVDSFGMTHDQATLWMQRTGLDNVRLFGGTASDTAQSVPAGLGFIPMGQWFGGRRVPCAGVAAVAVAREERGRGLAQRMMAHAVRELAEQKCALSCLYPATLPLYRGAGYEIAGARYEMRMPCAALVGERGSGTLVPIASIEDPQMRACQAQSAARANGELDRHETLWLRVLERHGERREGYAVRDASGQMRGYAWIANRTTTPPRFDVAISDFAALDVDAARTLLAFLRGHRSMARDVSWFGGTDDALRAALLDVGWTSTLASPWMTRITHLEAALVARGYASVVRGAIHLDVDDPLVSANHGRFVLEVENGLASVRRGGEGRVTLSIRDLAPIYTAYATAEARARFGTVRGSERDLALLSSFFAGPAPAMPDMF